MNSFIDYYDLLGVDPRAATGTIKAAFKKLALKYHPDVYKGEDAEERMRLLLRAYQILSDPVARKTYDAQRSEHAPGGSAAYDQASLRKSGGTMRSAGQDRY